MFPLFFRYFYHCLIFFPHTYRYHTPIPKSWYGSAIKIIRRDRWVHSDDCRTHYCVPPRGLLVIPRLFIILHLVGSALCVPTNSRCCKTFLPRDIPAYPLSVKCGHIRDTIPCGPSTDRPHRYSSQNRDPWNSPGDHWRRRLFPIDSNWESISSHAVSEAKAAAAAGVVVVDERTSITSSRMAVGDEEEAAAAATVVVASWFAIIQHFLCFFPDPHGHFSLGSSFSSGAWR